MANKSLEPELGWMQRFIRDARLTWRLLKDSRVPGWAKLIPVAGLLYILSPVDILPDVLIGLGQLDDLGLALMAMRLFISSSPEDVVRRHLAEMASIRGSYQVIREDKDEDSETTIDSTSRPLIPGPDEDRPQER